MTTMPPISSRKVLGSGSCLLATADDAKYRWLASTLEGSGLSLHLMVDDQALDERIKGDPPLVVFLDFTPGAAEHATQLAARLRLKWPTLTLVALGRTDLPGTTLAALRSGLDDFIDMGLSPDAVQPTLRELLERRKSARPAAQGRTVALLGARAGLGVTTLACNLTSSLLTLQRDTHPAATDPLQSAHHSTALLDLGLPARDGLLYLGLQSGFSFVEGVHNLQRLDLTLLQTALTQHSNGTFVLPLPANLQQMREVSHTQSGSLVTRLTDFFDLQIADLGGFTTPDFVAQVASAADTVWVVCDQSLGGIVSTAALLRDLREREVPASSLALVVNRFETHVDLTAQDVANQLELPLAHVLPARSTEMLRVSGQGQLIVQAAPHDPYSLAVTAMARKLLGYRPGSTEPLSKAARWAQQLPRWLGKLTNRE